MNGATRIGYVRRPSPLHAARATVAAVYGCALALAALTTEHPLLLGALLAAVLAASFLAGVGPEIARAARRVALPMVILTVLVNVLVSREGLTVFARLGDWGVLGQVNLTVEAVLYGLVLALRLLVVTLACLLVVCAADPDELLFSFRKISPHSALTAALTTRLIPVLGADARRLAEAQRCRPDGGASGARGKLAVLRATVAGALDRSLDVAAVLEMRGYGAARPARRLGREFSRHDLAFAAGGAAVLVIALFASVSGAGSFTAYPFLHLDVTAELLALAALLIVVALLPFLDRRGVER
jgi:energy-coupling factor transport system permease protein